MLPPHSQRGWMPECLRRLGSTVGSLLLGGAAVLGAMFAFRQGALPLIQSAFGLDADVVSAVRRVGLLATALLAYWAFVRLYERRVAEELSLRLLPIMLGAERRIVGCGSNRTAVRTWRLRAGGNA